MSVGKNAQTLGRNNHFVNDLLSVLSIRTCRTGNRNLAQLNIHTFIVLHCDVWVTAFPMMLGWLWFVQHNYQAMQILTASSKSYIKLDMFFRCVCLVIDSSVFRVKEHYILLRYYIIYAIQTELNVYCSHCTYIHRIHFVFHIDSNFKQ